MRALPANLANVKAQLLALPGIEIPVEHEDGRMVVIIDESGNQRAGEALMKIQGSDGVLSANLVYQHSEEDSTQDDEVVLDLPDQLNNAAAKS